MALRPRTPGARALLPVTRHRSSGPLGALLSSPALDVRLMTALQVLQERSVVLAVAHPRESASSYLSSQSLAASRCGHTKDRRPSFFTRCLILRLSEALERRFAAP